MMKKESEKTSVIKDSEGFYQLPKEGGAGAAILRFLPSMPNEKFPFVQIFTHAFPGHAKQWFIETCPTTIGKPCPVCDANKVLRNSGNDSKKKLAEVQKAKMNYVSNVTIIKDAKMPSNEGKVLLFKYGVKIMSKLEELVTPSFGDEPIDPFDSDEGANFRLRMTQAGGFPNYDKSSFDPSSKLGDEKEVNRILAGRRSLDELVDPKQFKSYEDLKKKFEKIVGTPPPPVTDATVTPTPELPADPQQ